MPTVLQINATASWGSTGKIAEHINQVAAAQGWKTYIAYGRAASPCQSELIHVGKMSQVYEHYFEYRLFDNEGLASRRATMQLVNRINIVKPDIIHLHNIHDHWLNYPILFEYLNASDIPIVWTFHDCWAFTGHCAHFVTAGCERWKTGCYDCPLTNSLLDRSERNFRLKQRWLAASSNLHIVAVSDWLAGLARQSIFKDKNIRVIKNGVDIEVFKPATIVKTTKFRVLGVSNVWTKSKGLNDFLRLRALLDNAYEIILVGLSKEQVKSLPEGIVGMERVVSPMELVSLYSAANVFVNPTYADTFPTVNIEALACGTPVITYRTGGSPEAVDAATGMVVEQGDIETLALGVKRFCLEGKREYIQACRDRAEKCFDKNDRFNDYLTMYQQIMRSREGR